MAKRVQKTQERRGQRPLQPDAEGKEPQQRVVPAEWGCQIRDAAVGRFVALEVMYEKPRGRAVEIAQVPLLCATCNIVMQGLHHNHASEGYEMCADSGHRQNIEDLRSVGVGI